MQRTGKRDLTMRQHGGFDIWYSNNIVYAVLHGSWNTEAALNFKREFEYLVVHHNLNRWGHIVVLDDWALGTPDIEPIVQELTFWLVEHGLKHAAQVFSASTIKRFQLNKMVTEQIDDFVRRQFEQTSEAVLWLEEQGYVIDEQDLLKLNTK
jgi:hypothetical protein